MAHQQVLAYLPDSFTGLISHVFEGMHCIQHLQPNILHLFICTYNSPGITLAIDELDSGIYEYLQGELLQIMQKSGLGQLIFTSHNLRPLEMLNSGSIIFATTNPENRYVRVSGMKPSNNLRLRYFRDITLGRDGEEL